MSLTTAEACPNRDAMSSAVTRLPVDVRAGFQERVH
jgi:hypothetical protein